MGLDLYNLRKCEYTFDTLKHKSKEHLINMFLELQKTTKGSMKLNDKDRKTIENLKVKVTKRKPFIENLIYNHQKDRTGNKKAT